MKPTKDQKKSTSVMEVLMEKSKEPIGLAKKIILSERFEDRKIRDAVHHYLQDWNDFTHPGSFSIACEAVNGNPHNVVRIQAAIAMIAAAFDIHDDIIDESEIKHARPTVFGKFGKNIALLLGNAFLLGGYDLLMKETENLSKENFRDIRATMKSALFETGNAHVLELGLRTVANVKPEEYLKVFNMKAASIEADFRIGATLGRGTADEIESLAKYGRIIGLLTQLREEFIDVFEVSELNQRLHSEYLPFPLICAMQDRKLAWKIRKVISKNCVKAEDVEELVSMVFRSGRVMELKNVMKEYVTECIGLVSEIKPEEIRNVLSLLASSMLEDLE